MEQACCWPDINASEPQTCQLKIKKSPGETSKRALIDSPGLFSRRVHQAAPVRLLSDQPAADFHRPGTLEDISYAVVYVKNTNIISWRYAIKTYKKIYENADI
ncbi:hypothetical protein IAE55_13380 [Paenibacillus sp. S28]|nr:hypothetical protein [Paenibacillus sp. S28]